jgi:hypothetical protein
MARRKDESKQVRICPERGRSTFSAYCMPNHMSAAGIAMIVFASGIGQQWASSLDANEFELKGTLARNLLNSRSFFEGVILSS